MTTKVKIDLKQGLIELEGSEEFVRSYLDEFKNNITSTFNELKFERPPKKKKVKATQPEESAEGDVSTERKTKAKSAHIISPERFDIHGGEKVPSLQVFFDEKKPGTGNPYIIAVIGYYITELLGNDSFSEGQIEYAYRMLKLKRPNHLRQIIVNAKNNKDFFTPTEVQDKWKITRTCEIFVSDKLPETKE